MNRIVTKAFVVLFLLALTLLVWRMYLTHVINGQLAKIRAAGQPTNGEELNRWYSAVADGQNAALVLTQAFALLKTINTDSDKRAAEVWKFKDKFPRRADLLTPEQVELIRWHVEANRPALAKAREALTLPSSRYPIDCKHLMGTELPHLAHLVSLAYLNQCTAALAIMDGQEETPVQNIDAILALARTLDNEPFLISQLVKLRMVRMAFATLQQRANAGGFSPTEIVSLRDSFIRIHATNAAAVALIGDRAMTIPYFRMTKAESLKIRPARDQNDTEQDSPLPCYGSSILRVMGYYELDYGSYLIGMNKAISLLSNAPPENLRAAGYFSRTGEESTRRRRTLSGQTMSAYVLVPFHENEGVAHQRIALASLAVEGFRNETGRPPERLDELMPKFLSQMPQDPFTGLELKYRRMGKGYVIYSVGPDRHDDGGLRKVDEERSSDKRSYDIAFTVDR